MATLSKDEILEIKGEIEKCLKTADMLASKLTAAGYTVQVSHNNTVYIFKKDVIEEFGERPGVNPTTQPNGKVPHSAPIHLVDELPPAA